MSAVSTVHQALRILHIHFFETTVQASRYLQGICHFKLAKSVFIELVRASGANYFIIVNCLFLVHTVHAFTVRQHLTSSPLSLS
jgi:hypothetical protein